MCDNIALQAKLYMACSFRQFSLSIFLQWKRVMEECNCDWLEDWCEGRWCLTISVYNIPQVSFFCGNLYVFSWGKKRSLECIYSPWENSPGVSYHRSSGLPLSVIISHGCLSPKGNFASKLHPYNICTCTVTLMQIDKPSYISFSDFVKREPKGNQGNVQ